MLPGANDPTTWPSVLYTERFLLRGGHDDGHGRVPVASFRLWPRDLDCEVIGMAGSGSCDSLRTGSDEALGRLMRLHAEGLLAFLRCVIDDVSGSDAVLNEIAVAVLRNRRDHEPLQLLKTWLCGLALNRAFMRLQESSPAGADIRDGKGRARSSCEDDLAADAQTAVQRVEKFVSGVHRLPVKQRAVVVLRWWAGMSYAEISQLLNRSEATLRVNMHYGLTRLRPYLGDWASMDAAACSLGDASRGRICTSTHRPHLSS